MKVDVWDVAFCGVVLSYMAIVPYTKVEESFNMQATHDLMLYGADVEVNSPSEVRPQ